MLNGWFCRWWWWYAACGRAADKRLKEELAAEFADEAFYNDFFDLPEELSENTDPTAVSQPTSSQTAQPSTVPPPTTVEPAAAIPPQPQPPRASPFAAVPSVPAIGVPPQQQPLATAVPPPPLPPPPPPPAGGPTQTELWTDKHAPKTMREVVWRPSQLHQSRGAYCGGYDSA